MCVLLTTSTFEIARTPTPTTGDIIIFQCTHRPEPDADPEFEYLCMFDFNEWRTTYGLATVLKVAAVVYVFWGEMQNV